MRSALEALPALEAAEVRTEDDRARRELAAGSDRSRRARDALLADAVDHASAAIGRASP